MSSSIKENPNIKVYCHFTPLDENEKSENPEEIYNFISYSNLSIHSQENIYNFNLDGIFPLSSNQQDIYNSISKNIINDVFEGYNNTIVEYGSQNSIKSYSIEGKNNNESKKEIIPKMIQDIFDYINNKENVDFLLKVSIMEITSQEKIKDLININSSDLHIKLNISKKSFIEGITEHYVSTKEEIISLLNMVNRNREQSEPNIDDIDYKGHFIFLLNIFQINKKEGITKRSKLLFIDLGCSKKSHNSEEKAQFLSQEIGNNSLSTLRKVIDNLSQRKSLGIPYKGSVLTQILEESLGGNSKTYFLLTCSPSKSNESETLNTLRLGEKIRKIKNCPIINQNLTYEKLKKNADELNEKIKEKDLRISQLEQFITLNQLEIPKYDKNFQNKIKNNIIIKNKCDNNIEDNLNAMLEFLRQKKDDEKLNNNAELIDMIMKLKDKYILGMKNLNKKIESLEKEINKINEIKYKLQQALIEKQTRNIENSFTSKNDDNPGYLNLFSEFLTNLKQYQEIQNNPKISEEIVTYENKVKSLENENDIIKDIINNKDYIIEKQLNYQYIKLNKEILDKEIQTDIEEEEILKMQAEFEKEKKYLMQGLEDKTQIISELKEQIIEIQNKNKDLENNIPLNEKKIRDKNIILENNLRELKKKYEESQVKRLLLENNCRKLNNYYLKKKENLNEPQSEIKEIKVNLVPISNIIKVIPGGQKKI